MSGIGRMLLRHYSGPDRVREVMLTQEPLLDPRPFADAAGVHVEDLVPLYKRDRERLIGDFTD